MGAVMYVHVDKLGGTLHTAESSLDHSLWLAHKCHYGAVGGFAGVYIEETDGFNALYGVAYLLDNGAVAPFAEIGHTFDNSFFHGVNWYFSQKYAKLSYLKAQPSHIFR
jgi:hypothetical protein